MSNVLIVIGSARPGRVADKILEHTKAALTERGETNFTVADLKETNLPFFDGATPPSAPGYQITNENALAWQAQVAAAEKIIFLTPEYNHTLSAIEKNAIDWLFAEWVEKPVSAVAYGWSGGSLAVATFNEVMGNVKADVREHAQLAFMKDINPDGTVLNTDEVALQFKAQLDSLFA